MRQIMLDTETTGLDPKDGHRVIEVACVEVANRQLTTRHFHRYINPERDIEARALEIHGLSREFLSDKPRFADIAADFLEFIRDSELVIHNAAFDVGFLNHELGMLKLPSVESVCASVVDTLKLARDIHPGKRNNLDALCERYQVSNSHRTLHGALLDAELLGEVYLAMTRGQDSLITEAPEPPPRDRNGLDAQGRARKPLRIHAPSAEELAAHSAVLAKIEKESQGQCMWIRDPAQTTTAPDA